MRDKYWFPAKHAVTRLKDMTTTKFISEARVSVIMDGEYIERRLEEKKLTKGDLAVKLGVSNCYITDMLKNHRSVPLDLADRIYLFVG